MADTAQPIKLKARANGMSSAAFWLWALFFVLIVGSWEDARGLSVFDAVMQTINASWQPESETAKGQSDGR